ncbi:MAG TPA: glycosyltransferase [Gryllotalpicola sp.]
MILLTADEMADSTGFQRSAIANANGLHNGGYPVVVLSFRASPNNSAPMQPLRLLDADIPVLPLQMLAADGGRLLHGDHKSAETLKFAGKSIEYSANQLAVLRQINSMLSEADTIIFTDPAHALAFHRSLKGDALRPRTVLQIRGGSGVDSDLPDLVNEARGSVSRIQTNSIDRLNQVIPLVGEDDVFYVPDFSHLERGNAKPRGIDGINVTLVAPLDPIKNQLDAVRALSLIGDESVHLSFSGTAKPTDPYVIAVKYLISALGLEDRVHLLGPSTTHDAYATADIVLSTSLAEDGPAAFVEAARRGIPQVSYDVPFGPRDVIDIDRSGAIIPVGDVTQAARHLSRLATDHNLRRSFGEHASRIFQERFSSEKVLDRYREMIAPGPDSRAELVSAFATDGVDPFNIDQISHRFYNVGQHSTHHVKVPGRIYDVALENRDRVRRPRLLLHTPGATHILFYASAVENITFTTSPGSSERHYLGSTVGQNGFEVRPLLRRDAGYSHGVPSAVENIQAAIGGAGMIQRHPRRPITSGVDNFGVPINSPGGVVVKNDGTPSAPHVLIRGEYDRVDLRDGAGFRHVQAHFTYGELFDRVCEAEREYGLLDQTAHDGVHIWELGRPALILQLCEAFGLYGTGANTPGIPPDDTYIGPKRLTAAPTARKVVFGFPRRGGSTFRTDAFQDDETLFIVPPEPNAYPDVTDSNLVFPIHEYNKWHAEWHAQRRNLKLPKVDARPFEEALQRALGIRVSLESHLQGRLEKFVAEREFFTPVFERVQPEEVLITQSHSRAGVSAAAKRAGALVSDIQYALTSRYHPGFWFGDTPRHGATRLYAWSEFWAERTNAYQDHRIVPRRQPELVAALGADANESPSWDVCVISQPPVFRRMAAFIGELVRERPELSVVIAPHPSQRTLDGESSAQRAVMDAQLAAAGIEGQVSIATTDVLETIRRSRICLGVSSTSLYEAVALNRPTYVIPAPSYEYVREDVESGLFRLANSPHDLIPYEVPDTRRTIFGLS